LASKWFVAVFIFLCYDANTLFSSSINILKNWFISSSFYIFSVGDAPVLDLDLEDKTVISPAEAVMDCEIRSGSPAAEMKW
jgi:hypothetical protein